MVVACSNASRARDIAGAAGRNVIVKEASVAITGKRACIRSSEGSASTGQTLRRSVNARRAFGSTRLASEVDSVVEVPVLANTLTVYQRLEEC